MKASSIAKSTQEQAVASWGDSLNQLRIDEMASNIVQQDVNLEGALEAIGNIKDFVSNPANILGNEMTKHGEIAEHVQVGISNAKRIVEGLKAEYTFEGVGRFAPEDYLRNDTQIQLKFVREKLGLNAIKDHLEKYPDFVKNGGKYQIPKDFYDALQEYAEIDVNAKKFFEETGISLDDIESAVINYGDVQKDKINETINKEESDIKDADKNRRDKFYGESKPTLQEGLKVTATAAAIEGGMAFCLGVASKLKSGKKLNEFTEEDWKDIGVDTAKGTGKGAIRGAGVYTLTNFTATPAAVASALVTASFGVVAQAQLLSQGKITAEEFIENSEVMCLDVSVSAIASLMGQMLIPIPVLGAIIGNAAGMFLYGIAKDSLSRQEQELIFGYIEDMKKLNEQLEVQHKTFVDMLKQEFAKFASVTELAFDPDVNIAFVSSVTLASHVGCLEEKILKDKAAIDAYFLG